MGTASGDIINNVNAMLKAIGGRATIIAANGTPVQYGAPNSNYVPGLPFRFKFALPDNATTAQDLRTAAAYSLDANLTQFLGGADQPLYYLCIDRILCQLRLPAAALNDTDPALVRQGIETMDLEVGRSGNLTRIPLNQCTTVKFTTALGIGADSDATSPQVYEQNNAGDPVGALIVQPGPLWVDLSSDLFQVTPREAINYTTPPNFILWVWGLAIPRNLAEKAGFGVQKDNTCPPSVDVATEGQRRVAAVPWTVRTLG